MIGYMVDPFAEEARRRYTQEANEKKKLALEGNIRNPGNILTTQILAVDSIKTHPAYRLFVSEKFKDFDLHYAGTTFRLHKSVLFTSCVYFRSMLEKNECTIAEIENVSVDLFQHFLIYLYTGLMNARVLKKEFYGITQICDYFGGFDELHDHAIYQIAHSLSVDNISEVYPFVKRYLEKEGDVKVQGLQERLQICMKMFFIRNSKLLARNKFPFHELGEKMLLALFSSQNSKDLQTQESSYLRTSNPYLQYDSEDPFLHYFRTLPPDCEDSTMEEVD
jgi:hypothetical protein